MPGKTQCWSLRQSESFAPLPKSTKASNGIRVFVTRASVEALSQQSMFLTGDPQDEHALRYQQSLRRLVLRPRNARTPGDLQSKLSRSSVRPHPCQNTRRRMRRPRWSPIILYFPLRPSLAPVPVERDCQYFQPRPSIYLCHTTARTLLMSTYSGVRGIFLPKACRRIQDRRDQV